MFAEAKDAPHRVREFLEADHDLYRSLGKKLRHLDPTLVGTIARGSSDHAATYASYLIPACTGRLVSSIAPSLVTVLETKLRLSGQFVLSLSQSGGSPDLVRAQAAARLGGAFTAALVNVEGSPLAMGAELYLPQRAGVENSITATKSVLCTLTGIARMVAEWAEDAALREGLKSLPDALFEAAALSDNGDDHVLSGISHAVVLSRSLGFGAATEMALKLKETSGIHAEAFSAAEVRHGPREIVNKNYLVIALALPGSGEADVRKAAEELKAQGAKVLVIGASKNDFCLPEVRDFRLYPLVALQLLYPWVARCAHRMGRNPDKPKTLASKVIQTV